MNVDMINSRIADLQDNQRRGQARLQELDQERQNLQQTLLRIDGAIQVLREMLAEAQNGEEA